MWYLKSLSKLHKIKRNLNRMCWYQNCNLRTKLSSQNRNRNRTDRDCHWMMTKLSRAKNPIGKDRLPKSAPKSDWHWIWMLGRKMTIQKLIGEITIQRDFSLLRGNRIVTKLLSLYQNCHLTLYQNKNCHLILTLSLCQNRNQKLQNKLGKEFEKQD